MSSNSPKLIENYNRDGLLSRLDGFYRDSNVEIAASHAINRVSLESHSRDERVNYSKHTAAIR